MCFGAFAGAVNHTLLLETRYVGAVKLRVQEQNLVGFELPEIDHSKEMIKQELVDQAIDRLEKNEQPLTVRQQKLVARNMKAGRYKNYNDTWLLQTKSNSRESAEAFIESIGLCYEEQLAKDYRLDEAKEAADKSRERLSLLERERYRVMSEIKKAESELRDQLCISEKNRPDPSSQIRPEEHYWRLWKTRQISQLDRISQRIKSMRRSQDPSGLGFIVTLLKKLYIEIPDHAENYYSPKLGKRHLEYVRRRSVALHGNQSPLLLKINRSIKELEDDPKKDLPGQDPITVHDVLDELDAVIRDRVNLLYSDESLPKHQELVSAVKRKHANSKSEMDAIKQKIEKVNATTRSYSSAKRQFRMYGLYSEKTKRFIGYDMFFGATIGFFVSVLVIGAIVFVRVPRAS